MAKDMSALQNALNGGRKAAVAQQSAAISAPATAVSYKAPSREGKIPITAYLPPDFKSSLRLIQAKRGGSVQVLVAEALNDLFRKYDVPTIEARD